MSAPPPYPGEQEKAGMPQPYQPAPAGGYPQQGPPQPGAYPPPQSGQPGAYGQAQQTSTVVVTQPTVVTTVQHFGEMPITTTCPHCHAQVVTSVHYETGGLAWLLCVILCVVGCNLGCCFIPFCIDGCKDAIHTCPNCNQMIGKHSRL